MSFSQNVKIGFFLFVGLFFLRFGLDLADAEGAERLTFPHRLQERPQLVCC